MKKYKTLELFIKKLDLDECRLLHSYIYSYYNAYIDSLNKRIIDLEVCNGIRRNITKK